MIHKKLVDIEKDNENLNKKEKILKKDKKNFKKNNLIRKKPGELTKKFGSLAESTNGLHWKCKAENDRICNLYTLIRFQKEGEDLKKRKMMAMKKKEDEKYMNVDVPRARRRRR